MWPDLMHRQLRPERDFDVLRNFVGELGHLDILQQFLDETKGAVVSARQEEALK